MPWFVPARDGFARPQQNPPEEFAARAARERPMWREMVRLSGATAD
jgi:hypothetical protein